METMINEKGGSFGIPEDMLRDIKKAEEAKREAKTSDEEESTPYTDAESIPEASTEKSADLKGGETPKKDVKKTENTKKEDEAKIAKEFEKSLGITFNHDDTFQMLFYNKLNKVVIIIPGMVSARFRSLSVDELDKVEEAKSEALELNLLENGFRSLHLKQLLSYGLLELGKPGGLKSIGETPEERRRMIGSLNTLLFEKIGQKWNSLSWLAAYSVNKETDSKNS